MSDPVNQSPYRTTAAQSSLSAFPIFTAPVTTWSRHGATLPPSAPSTLLEEDDAALAAPKAENRV